MRVIACILATALLVPSRGQADERSISREYQLKAAILYKLVGFIDWQDAGTDVDGRQRIEICTLGYNPFGNSLDRLIALEPSETKHIVLRRVESAKDAQSCQLVYISKSEEGNLGRNLADLRDSHSVLVSDIQGFAARGGTIELIVEGQFIRFIINAAPARENGIRLSSHLLALAKEVLGNV